MLSSDNPTSFMCQLSRNLGASTSWNPQGLSRPVKGLLYLYLYYDQGLTLDRTVEIVKPNVFEEVEESEPEPEPKNRVMTVTELTVRG